jgi:hypothetical protein
MRKHFFPTIALLSAAALLVVVSRAPLSAAESVPYTNQADGFSFVPPAGLTVTELPDDTGDGIDTFIIQDALAQHGVQLLVIPLDDPSPLTPARIEDETGLTPSNVEAVEEPAPGLSFTSDNDAWGGTSSDIWFIHAGNVYELTTYPKDAALLRAIVASWHFLSP